MKHNLANTLKKLAESATLSSTEKERLSHILSEYVSLRPLPKNSGGSTTSPHHPFMYWGIFTRPVALVLVIGVLVSGGSVSYAAEAALPGNILYPIKVSVNEEIRSLFALTPEKKALWSETRAERRLEEATKLLSQGELSDKIKTELARRFEAHAEKVAFNTETLAVNDAATAFDVTTAFEARLAAHQALLEEFNSPRSIVDTVREQVEKVTAMRLRTEGHLASGSQPAALAPSVESFATGAEESSMKTMALFKEEDATLVEQPGGEQVSFEVVSRTKQIAERAYREAATQLEKARLTEEDRRAGSALIERSKISLQEGAQFFEGGESYTALEKFRASLRASQKLVVLLRATHLNIPAFRERAEINPGNDPRSLLDSE